MKLYIGLLCTLCGVTTLFLALMHLALLHVSNNPIEWWLHPIIITMLILTPYNICYNIKTIKQQK